MVDKFRAITTGTANKSAKRAYLGLAKLCVGLSILGFLLLRHDNAVQLVESLRRIDARLVLVLFLISVGTNLLSSIKWGLFIAQTGRSVSQCRLFALYLVGKFFNNFLPSMVGGDIARVLILGRDIGSYSSSLASVIMERATGIIGLVVLVICSSLANMSMLQHWVVSVPIACAVSACAVMVAAYFSSGVSELLLKISERLPLVRRFSGKIRQIIESVVYFRSRRRLLLLSLALSVGFHFLACVNVYAACRAIGFMPAFADILVVTPVILLLVAIPVSPRSLGWWEWCFSFLLIDAGGTAAQGVAVALTLRVVSLVMSLVGGVFFLCEREMFEPAREPVSQAAAATPPSPV